MNLPYVKVQSLEFGYNILLTPIITRTADILPSSAVTGEEDTHVLIRERLHALGDIILAARYDDDIPIWRTYRTKNVD